MYYFKNIYLMKYFISQFIHTIEIQILLKIITSGYTHVRIIMWDHLPNLFK